MASYTGLIRGALSLAAGYYVHQIASMEYAVATFVGAFLLLGPMMSLPGIIAAAISLAVAYYVRQNASLEYGIATFVGVQCVLGFLVSTLRGAAASQAYFQEQAKANRRDGDLDGKEE